jgi:Putative auto-transporter adhesin, head GIN domain
MNRTTTMIGLAAAALALTACGSVQSAGPPTSQERELSGVHAVDLQTSGDLTIRIGETEGLTVSAGANVLDDLTSEVVDGTLVLGSRPNLSIGGSISYTLTVRGLDGIEVEGSGDVTGTGVLDGEARLTISGSGSATLSDLHLTSLSADLSGSGGAVVSGTGEVSTVGVSGSGDYDGSGLTTARTTVESSGSGQARVNVTERLSATVSGSGDVVYAGNPAQVDRDVSGSGEIVAD